MAPALNSDFHKPVSVFPFALTVVGSVVAFDLVLATEK